MILNIYISQWLSSNRVGVMSGQYRPEIKAFVVGVNAKHEIQRHK